MARAVCLALRIGGQGDEANVKGSVYHTLSSGVQEASACIPMTLSLPSSAELCIALGSLGVPRRAACTPPPWLA